MTNSYRTPLSRARGLGSAHHGVSHWIGERIASIVLLLLTPWALSSALTLAVTDAVGAVEWLGAPLNAVLSLILLVTGFYFLHASMRVVIEDYIHGAVAKTVCLLLNFFVSVLGGALAVFSVLKVALASGAF